MCVSTRTRGSGRRARCVRTERVLHERGDGGLVRHEAPLRLLKGLLTECLEVLPPKESGEPTLDGGICAEHDKRAVDGHLDHGELLQEVRVLAHAIELWG